MVQQIIKRYNKKIEDANRELIVELANFCRENLNHVMESGYRGTILLGAPYPVGPDDADFYIIERGHLYGYFPIGRKFFGLLKKLEKKEVTPEDIAFERYNSVDFLKRIAGETEKIVTSIS